MLDNNQYNNLKDIIDESAAYRQSWQHRSNVLSIFWKRYMSCSSIIFIVLPLGLFGWWLHSSANALPADWNTLKEGDKLYVNENAFEYSNQFSIFMKMRRINADDINERNIEDWQKKKLIAESGTFLNLMLMT